MHSSFPWDFALILFLLAVVVPWRGAVRVRQLMRRDSLSTADRLVLYASTIAFQWLATGVVLWRCVVHGYRPADVGLVIGRFWLSIAVMVALSVLITANQLISLKKLARLPPEKQGFFRAFSLKLMPQNSTERLAFFALVSTVAVCEEIIYRGFIQRFFQNLSHGYALVGLVASAVFFSVAHLYQGRRGLVVTFFVGVVFSAIRIWTGSLAPTIVAHFVADLAAGILGPVWLAEKTSSPASAVPPELTDSPGSA
ncbi:MAG: type II CAAX endopeptidase family protein [Candidatus Acidiferrales bacterium]